MRHYARFSQIGSHMCLITRVYIEFMLYFTFYSLQNHNSSDNHTGLINTIIYMHTAIWLNLSELHTALSALFHIQTNLYEYIQYIHMFKYLQTYQSNSKF